jgi:carbon-monoxide dehydrogenase medium subunit
MLNYRLARPKMLIDISNIAERNQVADEAHGIRVRATTVYRHVERSVSVEKRLPLLHKAIQNVAHVQIRNKGTLGGSIANADPAAEMPAMSLVFDAQLDVASKRGRRSIPAGEFFTTYMTTALQQDEVLESVFFAEPPKRSGWGFEEVARRLGDYALVGSTAIVSLDEAGKCARARVVLFGVAPTPVRATEAENLLLGHPHSTALVKDAARLVQSVVDPEADVHVTAAYRRSVSEVLTARVLDDAFRRASALQ